MAGGKKSEEEEETSPWAGVQKTAVLHEAKAFHDAQIDPRRCCHVLTEILYLLSQGEVFASEEATKVFFGVTKLFQCQDANLRRMVYLVIKELIQYESEVFVVIASLMKDVTGKVDLYRANAIRVLARVIDESMLPQTERFIKQSIVDKDPFVSSSSLVAGAHLLTHSPDIIKRWVNEVQEALQSTNKMVQYHALSLLYQIKRHDRQALAKVVTALCNKPPRSPLAISLLIRIMKVVLAAGGSSDASRNRLLTDYLQQCLHNKSSVVVLEAARAMLEMPTANENSIQSAVTALQDMLNSPISAQRFAAARLLSDVVTRFPVAITPCSVDLEHLITDPNRSIATLAITTLLKTGVESSLERLMKSISSFMNEISDELKIVLIEAIRSLCLKFPHKYESLMQFLSNVLRDEGGFQYKFTIVESIEILMDNIDAARDIGLEHLCEFIEDCEFPTLSIRILHKIGEEGPKTANPHKFIRFIFNRVILELPNVRAAAVGALGKFGAQVPALTHNVKVLLRRCTQDNDDEVRDRVAMLLDLLERNDKEQLQSSIVKPDLGCHFRDLEYSLTLYLQNEQERPFAIDLDLVKVEAPEETSSDDENDASHASGSPMSALNGGAFSVEQSISEYEEVLKSVPEFAALGTVFKHSEPVELTESEAEYRVTAVKHVFAEHVVIQFDVKNAMDDQFLENVNVEIEIEQDGWEEECAVSLPQLKFDDTGSCFVCLRRDQDTFNSGMLGATLHFTVKDADMAAEDREFDEGIPDEYTLEDIDISEADFLKPNTSASVISLIEYKRNWEALQQDPQASEQVRKFNLSITELQEAVDAVVGLLHMHPVENSNQVADGARSHACNMAGTFLGDRLVLARAGFLKNDSGGVTLKIAARSHEDFLSELVVSCIQ